MEKTIESYLPFILQRENIARIENDTVLIGDRRAYPFQKEFVPCRSMEEVAAAIETMVTQGGGPFRAAMMAMLLLAQRADRGDIPKENEVFLGAKERLRRTRPTNTSMARVLDVLTDRICRTIEAGESIESAVQEIIDGVEERHEKSALKMARIGADLLEDGDGVLTMCFAETSFILAVRLAMEDGKRLKIFTPETRPYLQGARLTAPCLMEVGADVTLITDGMGGYLMSQGKIQKYMTAVDIVTSDGWAANKVGTFQNAVCAHYHRIPYFPFAIHPDMTRTGRDSIVIEERNPEEVKRIKGMPTTREDMKALYPAFDIIPHLISGIITPRGLVSAHGLKAVYPRDSLE